MSIRDTNIISINNKRFNFSAAKENNLVGKKIQDARTRKGVSQGELADMLSSAGIPVRQGAVSKWEMGATTPSSYQLLAVCDVLEIPNGLDFFTDRVHEGTPMCVEFSDDLNYAGQRKLQAYRDDLIASGKYTRKGHPRRSVEIIEMPVSLLKASAGNGDYLDDENFEMKRFPRITVPDGADFGVYVDGDSMSPTYIDGQLVWVRVSHDLAPGDVGLFTVDDKCFIKVYDEKIPTPDVIEGFTDSYGTVHPQPVLVSYNEAYKPRIIKPDMRFSIIGRVL